MVTKSPQIRIMLFGTFDFLHKGHLHFFQQARKLVKNPYVIVSIARDQNVKRIKGKAPLYGENERAQAVWNSGLVDKVVLGGIKAFIPHIVKEHPAIIALGYDQTVYTEDLQSQLRKKGLVVMVKRLKPYKVSQYKSSLLKQAQSKI